MLEYHAQSSYDRAELETVLDGVVASFSRLREPTEDFTRILLKPNFVMPAARGDASVTHPDFYMALATVLQQRGFEVGIGESPAIGSCEKALKAHGVYEECRQRDIAVVEFRSPKLYHGVEGDRHFGSLTVAEELTQWHGVVNVPKLKTHQQFTFTAATKNLYGCVTGKRKFVRHNLCANDPVRFARMVIANATEVDCVAHIADGIEAMHVKGPRGGKPFPLGCVLASDSFLDLDWLFCRLIDLDPETTPLFRALGEAERSAVAARCVSLLDSAGIKVATGFRHAPLIHISFSPWHMARSGWRTVRYTFAGQ